MSMLKSNGPSKDLCGGQLFTSLDCDISPSHRIYLGLHSGSSIKSISVLRYLSYELIMKEWLFSL